MEKITNQQYCFPSQGGMQRLPQGAPPGAPGRGPPHGASHQEASQRGLPPAGSLHRLLLPRLEGPHVT